MRGLIRCAYSLAEVITFHPLRRSLQVGTAVSELGMVAKLSKEQPAETFEPEELDSKQFRKQFEVRCWGFLRRIKDHT